MVVGLVVLVNLVGLYFLLHALSLAIQGRQKMVGDVDDGPGPPTIVKKVEESTRSGLLAKMVSVGGVIKAFGLWYAYILPTKLT